jgi:hypothetical protein
MPRVPDVTIQIKLTQREAAYIRLTAINRFFDNIEKALKGNRECKLNLLHEDLPDAREYYETVFRKLQDEARQT